MERSHLHLQHLPGVLSFVSVISWFSKPAKHNTGKLHDLEINAELKAAIYLLVKYV